MDRCHLVTGTNLTFSFPEAAVQMSFLSPGTFRELEGLGWITHRHHSFHKVLNTLFSFVLVLTLAVTRNESRTSINNFVAKVVF